MSPLLYQLSYTATRKGTRKDVLTASRSGCPLYHAENRRSILLARLGGLRLARSCMDPGSDHLQILDEAFILGLPRGRVWLVEDRGGMDRDEG